MILRLFPRVSSSMRNHNNLHKCKSTCSCFNQGARLYVPWRKYSNEYWSKFIPAWCYSNRNPEALMSNIQILSLFSVLLSLGLLMVIMGQYKEMEILQQSNEQLTKSKQMAYNKLQHEIDFKRSLQDLKTKGKQVLKDLEAELAKLTTQLEGKKPEISACQEQLVCFI
ncbi:hypothetical protein XENOCAPTIV_024239 [Xenoophorus captivus]|uniref:Uncharacterized protein n=1 Tax=Xenoophorus captivus TaxID=1517983 RepID=A0ABV0QFF8_9TELE